MKKGIKILIIVIAIILVGFAILLWDNTRVIEQFNEIAIKKAFEKDGDNPNGEPYIYTIEQQENKIVLNMYGASVTVKLVRIIELEDGIVVNSFIERHYENKIGAKFNSDSYTDKKIKGNVVYGKTSWTVGLSKEEVLKEIEKLYGNIELID